MHMWCMLLSAYIYMTHPSMCICACSCMYVCKTAYARMNHPSIPFTVRVLTIQHCDPHFTNESEEAAVIFDLSPHTHSFYLLTAPSTLLPPPSKEAAVIFDLSPHIHSTSQLPHPHCYPPLQRRRLSSLTRLRSASGVTRQSSTSAGGITTMSKGTSLATSRWVG